DFFPRSRRQEDGHNPLECIVRHEAADDVTVLVGNLDGLRQPAELGERIGVEYELSHAAPPSGVYRIPRRNAARKLTRSRSPRARARGPDWGWRCRARRSAER